MKFEKIMEVISRPAVVTDSNNMNTTTQETELDLLKQRAKFAEEKQQLQMQIADINQRCCTRIPNYQFRELQQSRLQLNRRIANCEQWLIEIKGKLSVIRSGNGSSNPRTVDAKLELQDLFRSINDKWWSVTKDQTKTVNEQGMVALFCADLNQIQNKLSKL